MNVLIIGANGAVARLVEKQLIQNPKFKGIHTTLFLRNKQRVSDLVDDTDSTVLEGDLNNLMSLNQALKGQDIVVDTTGATKDLETTRNIVSSMQANQVERVISINDLGIYDEVPGEFGDWNKRMVGSGLQIGRSAADLYEMSGLDYTTLRLAWLSNEDSAEYEITQKGDLFKGTTVSRQSVAAVILDIISNPEYLINTSVGLNKPGTEGSRPQF